MALYYSVEMEQCSYNNPALLWSFIVQLLSNSLLMHFCLLRPLKPVYLGSCKIIQVLYLHVHSEERSCAKNMHSSLLHTRFISVTKDTVCHTYYFHIFHRSFFKGIKGNASCLLDIFDLLELFPLYKYTIIYS